MCPDWPLFSRLDKCNIRAAPAAGGHADQRVLTAGQCTEGSGPLAGPSSEPEKEPRNFIPFSVLDITPCLVRRRRHSPNQLQPSLT